MDHGLWNVSARTEACVGKWALVMMSCLYARWMQMAESRRGCTPAQQSMRSSNPLAFTSCLSAVAAELLISRPATDTFPWYNNSIPNGFQKLPRKSSRISCKKAGIPANSIRRKGVTLNGPSTWSGPFLTTRFVFVFTKITCFSILFSNLNPLFLHVTWES